MLVDAIVSDACWCHCICWYDFLS